MKLPPKLVISALSSKKFYICHFKDKNHDQNSPPHFFVFVPIKIETYLLICIITRQYLKLYDYYKSIGEKQAIDSLVYIAPNVFSFLKSEKGCVIDCNKAELLTKRKLSVRIDRSVGIKKRAVDADLSEELKTKIFKAIQNSPLVKKYIKKNLLIDQ